MTSQAVVTINVIDADDQNPAFLYERYVHLTYLTYMTMYKYLIITRQHLILEPQFQQHIGIWLSFKCCLFVCLFVTQEILYSTTVASDRGSQPSPYATTGVPNSNVQMLLVLPSVLVVPINAIGSDDKKNAKKRPLLCEK